MFTPGALPLPLDPALPVARLDPVSDQNLPSRRYDAVVVGAGVAGLAFTLRLPAGIRPVSTHRPNSRRATWSRVPSKGRLPPIGPTTSGWTSATWTGGRCTAGSRPWTENWRRAASITSPTSFRSRPPPTNSWAARRPDPPAKLASRACSPWARQPAPAFTAPTGSPATRCWKSSSSASRLRTASAEAASRRWCRCPQRNRTTKLPALPFTSRRCPTWHAVPASGPASAAP